MSSKVIDRLTDSHSLLNIMIKMEDFLDSLDLYVYKNWIDGEIVSGPHVSRYWVSMTLMYDYDHMPDPSGGLRLMKHGARVIFKKAKKEDTTMKFNSLSTEMIGALVSNQYGVADQQGSVNQLPASITQPLPTKKIWLVEIAVPRQFIDDAFDMDIGTMVSDENKKVDSSEKTTDDSSNSDTTDVSKPATDTTSDATSDALSSPEDGSL